MARIDPNEKTDLQAWLKMVAALQHAPDWPANEKPIEMKQTHISVLLLSKSYVVKLKKPVDFGFLDYTMLGKRERAVEDEVNLNRRLCRDVYIGYGGVIEMEGTINFSGRHGTIVDYCVWMKRLPEDRMLDQLVARGEVTEAMIDAIAARLSEFHRTARRGAEVAKWGSLAEIRHNWDENFAQTQAFVGRTISTTDYEAIQTWVKQWLATKADLFQRRGPYIVDGHGDVRCESVCVTDKDIYIYDCIEFNDRFRCDDVASEVAFLAMDLDARGRPDLGYFFTEAYERRIDDNDFFTLLPFYRCYRAFVRGKVLSFALNEAEFSPAEKDAAAQQAQQYFNLARRYATLLPQPTVITVTGLPGTGKTSVARAIAGEFGLRVVSADAMRKELFGAAKKPTGYEQGAYTPEANRLTYEKLLATGREYLQRDGGVVLDATFRRAEDRAQAQAMAAGAGAEWRRIECQLAPELVRARLEKRAATHEGLSDATWEIYLQQQAEQPAAEPDATWLILDTAGPLGVVAQTAADWLRSQRTP
ncbi:MAG TPA: AAA family ATPase [Blastocatellia bacterium]|nr:AAA family ATPase [Blastocatellia bacterium]